MKQERTWLLQEKYGGVESEAFHADCQRLEAGEPLAYVIGHTPFLNCTIHLDSKPLIPRSETEYWIEQAIKVMREAAEASPRPLRVLDLCAGSGCIGVAVAKALPDVQVDFAEVDPAHLPIIKKNLAANLSTTYSNRLKYYRVLQSDLFAGIPAGKTYDFILTNPPYIDPSLDRTELSVTDYEPHLALYGGRGGLELIAAIIAAAPAYLSPAGQLWLEHEPEHVAAINEATHTQGFTASNYSDQYGVKRYTQLVRLP